LHDGLDGQGALVGLLDDDIETCWEGGFLFLLALCALFSRLLGGLALVGFVAQGWVLVICFGVEGVEVGDGEGNADSGRVISRS
jgi:hypothetical protein